MITIQEGKKILEKMAKEESGNDFTATYGFKVNDGYVYYLHPDKFPKEKGMMDPFYEINFEGKLVGFIPALRQKEFKNGMGHKIML